MLNALKEVLPQEYYKRIHRTIINLRSAMPLYIDIQKVDVENKTVSIYTYQNRKNTDTIYTEEEIHSFVRQFTRTFDEAGWKSNIEVGTYKSTKEIQDISAEWVKNQIELNGIKRSQLIDDLDIDKHVLSKLLSNKFGFTRWHKAAFLYYFKSLQANESVEK